MIEQEVKESAENAARERFHDRMISLVLVIIWIVGVLIVRQRTAEITTTMLVIGTVFFFLLVPPMKELVKIIDKRVRVQLGLSEPDSE